MKADDVIEVPDYSENYHHEQTEPVRADSLSQGDYVVVPYGDSHFDNLSPGLIRGKTYELYLSARADRSGRGWVLIAFGAEMMKWSTAPGEVWHKRVPHDPPTCAYCLARFAAAQRDAGLTYSSAKGTVEAHSNERGNVPHSEGV